MLHSRLFVCALFAAAIVCRALPASDSTDRESFAELSDRCRRDGFLSLAKTVRKWIPPADGANQIIFRPPASGQAADATISAAESELFKEFLELRAARAERLFNQARAAAANDPSLAYALLWAALRENLDHAVARRALGFEKTEQGWFLPFSAQQIKAGRIWHDKFGWIARGDIARYEKGERRNGKNWLTAEQDARRHNDIRRGWKIETDHYIVTTNHSLEEGARLAAQLERLHHAWRQAFAGYWLNAKHLQERLDGLTASPQTPAPSPFKHRVTCFRDRDEYIRTLKSAQPRIEMSIGVYLDTPRTAYFFAGKEQDPGTIFHEATHQLFKETRKPTISTADRPNFWIVEAVACYMESLTARDDYDTLGEPDVARLPAARERLLDDGFYVPLAELVQYDAPQLQRDPRVAKIYSQSAGLAAFLTHHENGRYRTALMKYLEAVYTGKATAATLKQVTDTSFDELDRQYRVFLGRAKLAPRAQRGPDPPGP